MENYMLHVQNRLAKGHKAHHLRAGGQVPAVVYGGKKAPQTIQLDERELDRLLTKAGTVHLLNLLGDDFPETRVLIREVQRHPVRRNVLHVDFVRVARDQKITIAVPLTITGTAPATTEGAVLLQNVDSVEIECLPDDLPTHIEVDVSGLADIHARVTAADLALPKGVKIVHDYGDEPLVSLALSRAAAHEEEVEAEPAAGEPEIITERKRGEEEE